ncbi:PREDICTED: uncharacterized protein LOC104731070 [Camelina sativa]|uniref:Uncharacterized protein LOC104731070 n=1 Tax=Camelina sativa TaxID=90675 RepID=A0ABM1QRI9_CAMSA|nr:PREDICTED: uncharacterized protein LOC104731070 [Camelina sativa]
MTKSPLLRCRSSLVMSIRRNHDVLPCRKFVSGDFSHRRCFFRLLTGVYPLTRGYGGFTWVFDPGIKGGIKPLDGNKTKDRTWYISPIDLGLSFIPGFCVEYSCIEHVNGLLVVLTFSDGDVFSLPCLEYFILSIACMGCGVYGFKIKEKKFFDDDDGDKFPWVEACLLPERVHRFVHGIFLWYNLKQVVVLGRTMAASEYDGDVLSFPWSENSVSIERKIMATNRHRCVRRFQHFVLSFKKLESESLQATIQFFP